MDDEHHLIYDCQKFQDLRVGRILEILNSTDGHILRLFDQGNFEIYRFIAEAMLRVDEGVVEEPLAQQPRQADG